MPGMGSAASAGSAASGATAAAPTAGRPREGGGGPPGGGASGRGGRGRVGGASSPPRNSGRLPQMYSSAVWPAEVASALAGAVAPKLLAGGVIWVRGTTSSGEGV